MADEKQNLLTFFKENGTLLLAIYGVIQVWIIALWKKYIQRGKIRIFETGVLEIGYSAFGPTIAVNGTIRALRKNMFVSNIYIELTKNQDKAFHKFEWTAFRSTKISLAQPHQVTLELPSSFVVQIDQPYRYQIVLNDKATQSMLENLLLDVRRAWQNFLMSKQAEISRALLAGASQEQVLRLFYDSDFSQNSSEHLAAWDLLQQKNYWEPGFYSVKMVVKTADPDYEFPKSWKFQLDDASCKNLKLNSIATLQELCLGGIINYQYAYPTYINV